MEEMGFSFRLGAKTEEIAGGKVIGCIMLGDTKGLNEIKRAMAENGMYRASQISFLTRDGMSEGRMESFGVSV
ncbi:MAG: hypothetical protein DRG82_05095 [Deltaproteobacteria bacterium]|nr:MAG: hypothetical protein B1H13_11630 [Desulfobacteraceae bacterium 4484_190.3]RLB17971.1 MAG: hypothetical protein DRG82_05095 [Deltaproteobacteria bacterium]